MGRAARLNQTRSTEGAPKTSAGVDPSARMRGLAAFHLAAHIIAAWALGLRVDAVRLGSEPAADEIRRQPGTTEQEGLIATAAIVMDGVVKRASGRDPSCADHRDLPAAVHWASRQCASRGTAPSRRGVKAILSRWEIEAHSILAPHEQRSLALAALLYDRGSLTGEEIDRLLRGPSGSHETTTDAE